MKRLFILSSILVLTVQLVLAQNTFTKQKLIYKVAILDSGMNVTKGFLLNINDSAVRISNKIARFGLEPNPTDQTKDVTYYHIHELQMKRRGAGGRGAWKGALAGIVIGAVSGLIAGDDPPCQPSNPATDYWGFGAIGEGFCNAFRMTAADKALLGGALGGALGTGIGALTGALMKKKFLIGGKKEKFDEMKLSVLNKAYGSGN
jgi:hypothetical protein